MSEVLSGPSHEVSRRNFIKGAGITALTLFAALHAFDPGMSRSPVSDTHLVRRDGQDPDYFEFEEYTYLGQTDAERGLINLASTKDGLEGLKTAKFKTIFDCEGTGLAKPWASKLSYISDESVWALYFSAVSKSKTDDAQDESRRLYVAKGADLNRPFKLMGSLEPKTSCYAIDPRPWRPWDGETFLLFSAATKSFHQDQNLYIARMKSPWELEGERLLIAKPEFSAEMHTNGMVPGGIIEAGQQLSTVTREFISISGSATFTNSYEGRLLEYLGAGDPFHEDIDAFMHHEEPLLVGGVNGIYSPGAVCPNHKRGAKKSKVLYHCAKKWNAGSDRELRWLDMEILPNDVPYLGIPL